MFNRLLTFLFSFAFCNIVFPQSIFNIPIEGIYGRDYIVVNYVDWATGQLILDHNCGSKTYDGHQGTDFTLRSFAAMDSGVNVIAAADGIVTYVKDGLFDREMESDISKGFGNYVALSHKNGYQTYYAHLKKNQIKVKVGDSVEAGQILGQVGSSGNSTDPHLHFEVWFDSTFLIDPFRGNCGNQGSLWLDFIPYDTSFQLWNSKMCGFVPTLNLLREDPPNKNKFAAFNDDVIAYWNISYGLRKNDFLSIQWYTPDNIEWFKFDHSVDQDYWYYYYWSYIDLPDTEDSRPWKVILYRNGLQIDEKSFFVNKNLNSIPVNHSDKYIIYPNPSSGTLYFDLPIKKNYHLKIFNINGQLLVEKLNINEITLHQRGVYLVEINDGINVIRRLIQVD